MEYTITKDRNVFILRLSQNITVYQIGHFREAFEELRKKEEHGKNVVLDFEEVNFIDPLALGIITSFAREIRKGGGDVKIARMNDAVKDVFDESRLSTIYGSYASVKEAEKSFI